MKIYLTLFLSVFLTFHSFTQGWLQEYSTTYTDKIIDVEEFPQGGFAVIGEKIGVSSPVYFTTDSNGILQHYVNAPLLLQTNAFDLLHLSDQNLLILGYSYQGIGGFFDSTLFELTKIDSAGNILFSKTLTIEKLANPLNSGIHSIQSSDNFIYITYTSTNFQNISGFDNSRYTSILKIDANGNLIWQKNYALGNDLTTNTGIQVQEINPQQFIIANKGYVPFGFTNSDYFLFKFNDTGDSLSTKNYNWGNNSNSFSGFYKISSSQFLVVSNTTLGEINLFTVNDNLDSVSFISKPMHIYGFDKPSSDITSDQHILLEYNNGKTLKYITKIDLNANIVWHKKAPTSQIYYSGTIKSSADNNAIVFNTFFFPDHAFIQKIDSLSNSYDFKFSGIIYHDENANCTLQTTEKGLRYAYIQAYDQNLGITLYASSNDTGYFEMYLDTSQYEVVIKNYLPYFELNSCLSDTFNMQLIEDSTLNIPFVPIIICPYLTVDISAPYLRRCFSNNYTVKYCNLGTEISDSAYILIDFDPYIEINSASIPYNFLSGNTFRFDVGQIPYGTCGNFTVNFTVNCDSTVLGQTHCTQAHIYPDSICLLTDPSWDGSIITVDGRCINDTIEFTVSNVGPGNMSAPLNYIIIEDDLMYGVSPFQLNSGLFTEVLIPGNGSTYRMQAEQSPFYILPQPPSVTIEGCAGFNSLGFVTILPENDAAPFISIDCQENIGAYDPNDKYAYPKGVNNEKFITNTDELEYRIRFQNTGTDTAFNIFILDTISSFLDITTLIPGTSSHPYEYTVYGERIAKFYFPNILLPDSNTNEPESNGFVKFKIQQIPNNPDGTVITNTAAIYFDFNEPIITNTEFNTIGKFSDFIEEVSVQLNYISEENIAKVFPNPFNDIATITLDKKYSDIQLNVYTMEGRLIHKKSFIETSQIQLRKEELVHGVLIFEIVQKNECIVKGKIIAK